MTDSSTDDPENNEAPTQLDPSEKTGGATKTPMFEATHALRYQRQALIRQIQEASGTRLICYVSGSYSIIGRDDVVYLADLLHNIPSGTNVDLLLHTFGGDVDAAEKLTSMVHAVVGDGQFRIVIPDHAKSAGTLMALGADRILMSDSSELGPIDPQVTIKDANGAYNWHSVHDYLSAYKLYAEMFRKDPTDAATGALLSKFDPARLVRFDTILRRARKLAEKQLGLRMFKPPNPGNVTLVADLLISPDAWPSHGQMIGWRDAAGPLQLVVDYMDRKSERWRRYWQLYCLQRLAIREDQKLFESDFASLVCEPMSQPR